MVPRSRLGVGRAAAVGFGIVLGSVWLARAGAAWAQPVGAADQAEVLRAYPCPAGQAESTAAQLQAWLSNVPGVRVAADPRGSQVLVQAPASMQAQIAQRMGAAAEDTAPARTFPGGAPDAGSPASAGSPGVPSQRTVALRNITATQLEDALSRTFGQRMAAYPDSSLQRRRMHLSVAAGGGLDLTIDRQANRITVEGPAGLVVSCLRLVDALDSIDRPPARTTRLVSLWGTNLAGMRRMVGALQAAQAAGGLGQSGAAVSPASTPRLPVVAMLFQQPGPENQPPEGAEQPFGPGQPPFPEGAEPGAEPGAAPGAEAGAAPGAAGPGAPGLVGPVQVQLLEGLDVIVIRGFEQDVERVMELIRQIEQVSAETEPAIEVYHLRHTDSEAMADLVAPLYDEIFLPRRGACSITALVKPNALLMIGRPESVQQAVALVAKLDRPVAPGTQFQVFRLRFAAADAAATTIEQFFVERPGLAPRVLVVSDFRSNSVILQAAPRDMAEAAALIAKIDTPVSEAVNEIRVFQLENALADELAPVLQEAISMQAAPGAAPGAAPAAAAGAEQKSMMLRFLTLDAQGRRQLSSGILTDVRITADVRANSLMVSAPADSMELIAALIREMDRLPAAEAQIKVFTIVNGDAAALADTLDTLFGQAAAAGQPPTAVAAVEGESTLVPLRFAIDLRTNSIIASGSRGFLDVVEAILLRLDSSDVRERKNIVYRLKNAPAVDVATSINEFLRTERQVELITPGILSPFEQIEREVVVVPEPVSNSLIVSATPRYFEEIRKIVEQLDERPPMVMIQVLIAEVQLSNTDELGVELGLQDSVLFNRSLLGDIFTVTQTNYDQFGNPVAQNETIASATYDPGFAFNNQPLGNSSSTGFSRLVGTQGLSSFGVSRVNSTLGYGGFVFNASSESVSVLVRALKDLRRLEVLARPQIMTLDNQPAFIQVGQRVPRITGVTINQTGQLNNITLDNVGLILGVTPRTSPDGLVAMEIDAERSELGPEAEGIPVSISANGDVIRSPRIDTTTAQTTVSALSGQTVVLGGLISKNQSKVSRKVPLLGDIPGVGFLFRYNADTCSRRELLIIMTPHIVRNQEDADRIKQTEAARMHWCLADVIAVHEDGGLRGRSDEWTNAETVVVYPDLDPRGNGATPGTPTPAGPDLVPIPDDLPEVPEMSPDGVPVEPQGSASTEGAPTVSIRPTPAAGSTRSAVQPAAGAAPAEKTSAGGQSAVRPAAAVQPQRQPAGRPGPVGPAVYWSAEQRSASSGGQPPASAPAYTEAPPFYPPAYRQAQ